MSDPYFEATRKTRKGMPTWGKILLAFGILSAAGFIVLVVLGVRAVDELGDRLGAELTGSPTEVFADMTKNVLGDDVTIVTEDQPVGHVALRLGEDGSEVPVDLSEFGGFVEDGLTMIQEGVNKGVRFEGRADESGVSVTVRGPGGRALFELEGDEDGGFMRVTGEDGEVFFGLGDEAARAPGWLPIYQRARVQKQLFSYDSGDAKSGGLILVADDDPEKIFEWYVEQLREGDGPVARESRRMPRCSTATGRVSKPTTGVPGAPGRRFSSRGKTATTRRRSWSSTRRFASHGRRAVPGVPS
ncbi:MAG: hypothetical protein F4087_10735 [Gemmatimonadetes bacterium]|nr:hypothetical protein [Gemmatimonadota bacterium]MYE71402.1 hypothetical protein [Gemmatimonadota bacterium]MYJ68970.1 hypothetical protein [Gemmatimonadota bacterium]